MTGGPTTQTGPGAQGRWLDRRVRGLFSLGAAWKGPGPAAWVWRASVMDCGDGVQGSRRFGRCYPSAHVMRLGPKR